MIKERKINVDNFVVKLRAYPTKVQREKIDKILIGLRVAYNTTAYEIIHENEAVTNVSKEDGVTRFPNFSACMKKAWLDFLREQRPIVKKVPATSLSSSVYGIFTDLKKSWENFHPEVIGKQAKDKNGNPRFHKDGSPVWERTNKPVKVPCKRWEPDYYSNKKPRTSFTVQTNSSAFDFPEGSKNVYIGVTGLGKVKTRGWRFNIGFGENGEETFTECYRKKPKAFGVTVSKDNCGDYWLVVKLQSVWIPDKSYKVKKPVGVDVGIKDIAITSEGDKYENKHFKRAEKRRKVHINRKLSRRQGWANEKFREAHKKDKSIKPSASYERTKLKLARLERKISRRRENYNHNVTAKIVNGASFIGIEDLNVSGMMANHHLADALSDAAMSNVLTNLKYKAKRRKVEVVEIGRWDPSSKICSTCGYKMKEMPLSVREWTCPECKTHHDRDVNAAINILRIAQAKAQGKELKV